MSQYVRIPLQAGDRIRLESPEAKVRTVVRVTMAAAYIAGDEEARTITCRNCRYWAERRQAPPESETCQCRTFMSRGEAYAISYNALVWPE